MYAILKTEGKRAFCSWRFILCTIAIGVLWYGNSRRFAYDEDILTMFFDSVGRSTVTYAAIAVCNCVYGLSICEELQGGMIKEILSRIAIKRYVASKVLLYMLASMGTYISGNILYLLYEASKHPIVVKNSMIVENLKELTAFHVLLPEHPLVFMMLQIMMSALCCSCVGLIAMALSPYLRDGFLILGMPVVLFFLLMFLTEFLGDGSLNFESAFWSITATPTIPVFLLRILCIILVLGGISVIILYRGIQRYMYE